MSKYLPPMKGGQSNAIVPGPVRGSACPTPTEIVVIEARKVFDFCFQEDLIERCFFVPGLSNGAVVTQCEIVEVDCQEIMDREPIADHDGLALVSIQVVLTLSITIVPAPHAMPITVTRQIAFPKRVVLCAPTGTEVRCDVRGTCICTIQPQVVPPVPPVPPGPPVAEPNICCTIQLCIVVQSTADVKVLVPSFGIVMPQECRTAAAAFGGCPPLPPDICPPIGNVVHD